MQIFYTSSCPEECARFLDDNRVIKMVTETAQILSTALHVHQSPLAQRVYRATHRNHPCVRWASASRGNYLWLLRHFKALAMEYELRRGKTHAAWSKTWVCLALGRLDVPEGPLTTHANVAKRTDKGIDYSHLDPVDHAYRVYLDIRWETDKREPTWTGAIRTGGRYDELRRKYALEETSGPLRLGRNIST